MVKIITHKTILARAEGVRWVVGAWRGRSRRRSGAMRGAWSGGSCSLPRRRAASPRSGGWPSGGSCLRSTGRVSWGRSRGGGRRGLGGGGGARGLGWLVLPAATFRVGGRQTAVRDALAAYVVVLGVQVAVEVVFSGVFFPDI